MKKSNGVSTIILVSLVVFAVIGAYMLGTQKTKTVVSTPTVAAVATPYPESTLIPDEVANIFSDINKGLSTNFFAIKSNMFYSNNGDIEKKSWTLDFTSAIKEKSHIVIVKNILEKALKLDITKSAGGAGQSVDAYDGKGITCYLLLGIDNKNRITCSTK